VDGYTLAQTCCSIFIMSFVGASLLTLPADKRTCMLAPFK
jgi:hypothetical protein